MTSLIKNNFSYFIHPPLSGTSIGVIGRSGNAIDYTGKKEDIRSDEKSLLHSITAVPFQHMAFLDQVHEDTIITLNSYPVGDVRVIGNADGMITNLPELCLVIRTADCVPVFAYDARNKILGAAHSGWKGTRLRISSKLVTAMRDGYGSRYEDICVFILPSIGPEVYEVSGDVADFFPQDIIEKNGKCILDLWGNIERSLVETCIPRENIFNARRCNYTHNDEFFSHRKGDVERNINFGVIRSC